MKRLMQGMYGVTEKDNQRGLFELQTGQTRKHPIFKKVGWYNLDGEPLGWGDLDADDLRRIEQGLEPGEVFIIYRTFLTFKYKFLSAPPRQIHPEELRANTHNFVVPGKTYSMMVFKKAPRVFRKKGHTFYGVTLEEKHKILNRGAGLSIPAHKAPIKWMWLLISQVVKWPVLIDN